MNSETSGLKVENDQNLWFLGVFCGILRLFELPASIFLNPFKIFKICFLDPVNNVFCRPHLRGHVRISFQEASIQVQRPDLVF